jgi:glycosyltransferase involved in cell wall biosynthesis
MSLIQPRGWPLRSASLQNSKTCAAQPSVSRRTHVMYVIDRLYIQGGGEEALIRTVQNLPRNQFRVSVVTFEANPDAACAVWKAGAMLHVFPMRRAFDWNGLSTALELRRLIRSGGVDIVHTFFETANIWGGLVAKLSWGPLLISSRRDMGILRSRKHRIAYPFINRLADAFVAVSDGVRDFCIKTERIDPERVFTIYNSVDLNRVDATDGVAFLRSRLCLPKGVPAVVTVANVRRFKGLDTLLHTAAIVRRWFPNVRFLIAGHPLECKHYQELQELMRQLDLCNNVVFLGHCGEVLTLLKLSDVFCLLSRTEGFSNALLEAMACWLPCVVTKVGGNPEAIEDGKNGFLVSPEDPEAAARRICMLLDNPEYAKAVGHAARKTVEEKFTSQRIAVQIATLYKRLAGLTIPPGKAN